MSASSQPEEKSFLDQIKESKDNYLGEESVDVATTRYANYTATDWALFYIDQYGQIDGTHHKLWVIDQVARILHGTPIKVTKASWSTGEYEYRENLDDEPSEAYKKWRKRLKNGYLPLLSENMIYTPVELALFFIGYYGQDSGHSHKNWVMDTVVRVLYGTPVKVTDIKNPDGTSDFTFDLDKPSKGYLKWRRSMLPDVDSDGEETEGRGYDKGEFYGSGDEEEREEYDEGCPP